MARKVRLISVDASGVVGCGCMIQGMREGDPPSDGSVPFVRSSAAALSWTLRTLRGIAAALEKAPRNIAADAMVQLTPILLELEHRATTLLDISDNGFNWTQLTRPGSDAGPCATNCEHMDCARIRRKAESKCRVCG